MNEELTLAIGLSLPACLKFHLGNPFFQGLHFLQDLLLGVWHHLTGLLVGIRRHLPRLLVPGLLRPALLHLDLVLHSNRHLL